MRCGADVNRGSKKQGRGALIYLDANVKVRLVFHRCFERGPILATEPRCARQWGGGKSKHEAHLEEEVAIEN